jgi:hypothetical protein
MKKIVLCVMLMALCAGYSQGQELATVFSRTIKVADTVEATRRPIDTTYSNRVPIYGYNGDKPYDAYGLYYWQSACDSHLINRKCSLWVSKQATYDNVNWTTVGAVDTILTNVGDSGFVPHYALSPTRLKMDSVAALWNAREFRMMVRMVLTFTGGVNDSALIGKTYTQKLKLKLNGTY